MEKHAVARLIGAPPGYIGYEQGGYLTEAVRRRPYSLVLLDEIEKAHPDVLNVLLQVLDDGRLTDGQGRTVDFRNTVIVMTSNLGSEEIQALSAKADSEEDKYEDMKTIILNIVSEHFRPEFINRIDDIVVFHALQKEEVREIANIQINHLRKRLEELDLQLQISPAALDLLANDGFDPVYGARPLKRAIQSQLETPLAKEILSGSYAAGETITIDVKKGSLVFAF
jgi:ATP-dependent Clp protease ATP-binding subunit ClpB